MLLIVLLSLGLAETVDTSFNRNTADVLDDGQWSVGVFSPLRYGISDTLELSIHPGWAILAPHIGLKKSYGEKSDWEISSYHRLGYPTPMLNFFARPGIGGMLAADSKIPHVVSSENQILFTSHTKQSVLTLSAGVAVAVSVGESDYRTIDVPYGYRKTALYQHNVALSFAVAQEYMFTDKLGYRYETKGWYIPLAENSWTIEDANSVFIQLSDKAQLMVGANIVVGDYPYGINWHILPTFDTIFVW